MDEKKKLTTSKKLVLFLFINCAIIEVFAMVMIALNVVFSKTSGYSPDFSPLNALIGAIVGEVIGFGIYAIKSGIENSEGGVTYLNAVYDLEGKFNKEREESNDDDQLVI